MLYYREALRLQDQDSAERILDVGAAYAGGKTAKKRIDALTKAFR